MSDNVTDPIRLVSARHARSCDDLEALVGRLLPALTEGQLVVAKAVLRVRRRKNDAILEQIESGQGDLAEQMTSMTTNNQTAIDALKAL